MSSMCAVALKQRTTTKKLQKRPRKKTMISEINLPLFNILKKDKTQISARALPLLCQILELLSAFILKVIAETTQQLQKFLVSKENYPRYLRLILLKWWKWIPRFIKSLNFQSLKEFSNQNLIKDKEKFNLTRQSRTKEKRRSMNWNSKITNESNINVDETLLTIVKYKTAIPFNLKLMVQPMASTVLVRVVALDNPSKKGYLCQFLIL